MLWFAAAGVATAVLTRPLIGVLYSLRLGKTIRADGPAHAAKAGTPTMGGLALVGTVLTAALLAGTGPDAAAAGLVFAVTLAYAALGALDDLSGLGRLGPATEAGVGLSARRMLGLQLAVAIAAALVLPGAFATGATGTDVWPVPILIGLAVVAILGTVNGVNMADGLDGLAAGLLTIAFMAQAVVIHVTGGSHGLTLVALAASGACMGFLVWNRHPARVMMGNVTSMAMGSTLAALALVTGTWWLLPVVGAVFVAEVASVILQVGFFKWSGGRRIFRMAPLHHHFEAGGLAETGVVARFWLAGLLAGAAAIALARG